MEGPEKRQQIIQLISDIISYVSNTNYYRSYQWQSFLFQLPRMIRQRNANAVEDHNVVEWLEMVLDLTKDGYLFNEISNSVDITFDYDGIIEVKGGLFTNRQIDRVGTKMNPFLKYYQPELHDCDPVTQFRNIIKKRKYAFNPKRIRKREEERSKAERVYLGATKELLYDCKHWSNIPASLDLFNQRYGTNFTIKDVSAIRDYETTATAIMKEISDMNDRREALEEYKEEKRTSWMD